MTTLLKIIKFQTLLASLSDNEFNQFTAKFVKQCGRQALFSSFHHKFIIQHRDREENAKKIKIATNIIKIIIRSRKNSIACIKNKLDSLLKSDGFINSFSNCNRKFTKKDLDVWLRICNQNIIPPYKLLVEWLKKQKKFTKNKEIKEWILEQEGKGFVESLAFFANEISKCDSHCWRFEVGSQKRSQGFEDLIYDKIKMLLKKNKLDDIQMMTEEEQRELLDDKDGHKVCTPDILLSDFIMINGVKIRWIEMKNYFINKDGVLWRKNKKMCGKYTKQFGCGAIVCRGFEQGLQLPGNVLLLDAFHY